MLKIKHQKRWRSHWEEKSRAFHVGQKGKRHCLNSPELSSGHPSGAALHHFSYLTSSVKFSAKHGNMFFMIHLLPTSTEAAPRNYVCLDPSHGSIWRVQVTALQFRVPVWAWEQASLCRWHLPRLQSPALICNLPLPSCRSDVLDNLLY